jgi:hypothetical protein
MWPTNYDIAFSMGMGDWAHLSTVHEQTWSDEMVSEVLDASVRCCSAGAWLVAAPDEYLSDTL